MFCSCFEIIFILYIVFKENKLDDTEKHGEYKSHFTVKWNAHWLCVYETTSFYKVNVELF